jgi:hypothetical protein
MSNRSQRRMMTGRATAPPSETSHGPGLGASGSFPLTHVVLHCGQAATCVNGPGQHQWRGTCTPREEAK